MPPHSKARAARALSAQSTHGPSRLRRPPRARHPLLAADRDERVHAAAQRFQSDGVALLERLVNIDTGTGHGPGLEQLAGIAADELRRLGAQVELVTSASLRLPADAADHDAGGGPSVAD